MSVAEAEIERIVRQVLRQLDSGRGLAEAPAVPRVASADQTLQISEPVITLAHLEHRLASVKCVVVARTAVVTPAANDVLKQRGIELRRIEIVGKQTARSVVLAVAETKYDAAGLARSLMQAGMAVERLAQCGLVAAVDELTDAVAHGGKVGMLLTRQTAAALCLTNRTKGVQAVLANNLESVRAARTTLAANLLVVDPQGRAAHELAAMVRTCATLAPHCSDLLGSRLK